MYIYSITSILMSNIGLSISFFPIPIGPFSIVQVLGRVVVILTLESRFIVNSYSGYDAATQENDGKILKTL